MREKIYIRIYLDAGRINGIGFQLIERLGNNLSVSAEISKREVDQIRRPVDSKIILPSIIPKFVSK